MTFASKLRKSTLAALAALTFITAAATIAPTQAQAGNNLGAFIGGALIGGFIGAATQTYNPAPVYRTCFTRWETRYNSYGQAYNVQVRYC